MILWRSAVGHSVPQPSHCALRFQQKLQTVIDSLPFGRLLAAGSPCLRESLCRSTHHMRSTYAAATRAVRPKPTSSFRTTVSCSASYTSRLPSPRVFALCLSLPLSVSCRCQAWGMNGVFLCTDDASLKQRLTNALERTGQDPGRLFLLQCPRGPVFRIRLHRLVRLNVRRNFAHRWNQGHRTLMSCKRPHKTSPRIQNEKPGPFLRG